jgi:hypothetical protein
MLGRKQAIGFLLAAVSAGIFNQSQHEAWMLLRLHQKTDLLIKSFPFISKTILFKK